MALKKNCPAAWCRCQNWDKVNDEWVQMTRKEDSIPLPEYRLNFLWLETNIAVAVDQVFSRVRVRTGCRVGLGGYLVLWFRPSRVHLLPVFTMHVHRGCMRALLEMH